jgi:hypothetical protein
MSRQDNVFPQTPCTGKIGDVIQGTYVQDFVTYGFILRKGHLFPDVYMSKGECLQTGLVPEIGTDYLFRLIQTSYGKLRATEIRAYVSDCKILPFVVPEKEIQATILYFDWARNYGWVILSHSGHSEFLHISVLEDSGIWLDSDLTGQEVMVVIGSGRGHYETAVTKIRFL